MFTQLQHDSAESTDRLDCARLLSAAVRWVMPPRVIEDETRRLNKQVINLMPPPGLGNPHFNKARWQLSGI
jgi:hypothetical protein